MREILNELKKKYLSFDKSKSNKNFILNSDHLTNINNVHPILNHNININIINSNDILLPNKLEEKILTERYKIRNRNNFYNKSHKTMPNIKFKEMYNESMKKIFRNKIKKKLPDLKNITNSSNLIIQKIRRHVLFTEENYPYSLKDNEYGYKTLRAREKKDILKEYKCILEQVDNEEFMSKIKLLYNEELMNKEKIYFYEKNKYNNIIKTLINKIYIFKYEQNYCLTKEFYTKRDYKTYLAGKLSINSVLIKIINIKNNKETNIFLPFEIIPFYLSIQRIIFCFFISKILSIYKKPKELDKEENNYTNKIIIDEKYFEKYLKIIVSNYQLFDSKSILFDEKKLMEESFYLFIDEDIYSLTIIPPSIELTKNEGKIKITKIISKGLWLYLFQNNYKNWDEICLIYLYSFNIFRQIQYSSIKFSSKQILNLNIDDKNNKNDYIPKIKNIDKNICFYAYVNNKEFKDESNFFFMNLWFYSLDQIYQNKKQIYKLYFSLEQSKILYTLNNQDNNLLLILYKCSLENEQHKGINLNFPLIKEIQKGEIKNYFYQNNIINQISNNKKISKSYKNKYNYKKGLKIQLNLPTIEIYELNTEKKIVKKTFEIKEEFLKKMIEINLIEMLKEIIKFVINNSSIDVNQIKTNDKKNLLRAQTQNMIKFKNNASSKNELNNKQNNKDILFERKSLFNKNIHIKIYKK